MSESGKTFAELTPLVESARAQLSRRALEGVSEDQARFRPPGGQGEGAWCVVQVLHHVTGAERRTGLRIRALVLGEELPPMSGQPPVDDGTSVAQLASNLGERRRALMDAVGAVQGKEQLDRTTRHAAFGDLNCRAWFRLQALHEEDHARQIEKIKAHADYPKR